MGVIYCISTKESDRQL